MSELQQIRGSLNRTIKRYDAVHDQFVSTDRLQWALGGAAISTAIFGHILVASVIAVAYVITFAVRKHSGDELDHWKLFYIYAELMVELDDLDGEMTVFSVFQYKVHELQQAENTLREYLHEDFIRRATKPRRAIFPNRQMATYMETQPMYVELLKLVGIYRT